jgi:large subunit ribosomal protein L18
MTKNEKRQVRHARIRAKVAGVALRPRLSIFRSNRFIYAQLIDDTTGRTLVAASDLGLKDKVAKADTSFKVKKAEAVGKLLAKSALDQGIKAAVFDRSGYQYTGRVKALAEGARAGGLEF